MGALPTIAKIARHCKVSTHTASLALRNSHRVAQATRDRVQAGARTLGYRPNPLINALMARVRNRRNRPTGDVLGFIISREKAIHPGQLDHQARMLKGASARARELGYRIEPIRLTSVNGRGSRLQQVLDTCHARGWNRPCILLGQHVLEAVDQGFLAGYLTSTHSRHHRIPVPPLLYADDAFNRRTLLEWVKKHRVDAVLSLRHDTPTGSTARGMTSAATSDW
jgi:hypothetical protein